VPLKRTKVNNLNHLGKILKKELIVKKYLKIPALKKLGFQPME